jgi:Skp family chaperone for outer membrane proteins
LGVVAVLAAAVGGLSAGLAGTAIGQPAAGQARPTVVAVVSISKILTALREREDKEAELRNMGTQRESVVNALGEKARSAVQELEVLKAGTDDWKAKREEAMRFEAQFRLETEIAERTLSEYQKLMQLALFNKITAAVRAYAEREGIDLVLTNDSGAEIPQDLPDQQVLAAMTGRRVAFASEAIDITDEVALAMNNEYKAP